MGIQVKVTGNASGLKNRIQEAIKDETGEKLKVILKEVSQDLVDYSPLGNSADAPNGRYATGEYLSKHTVTLFGGSPNPNMKQAIDSAAPEQLASVTFRNHSKHAQQVEHGGPNWRRRGGYKVYEKAAQKLR